MIRTVRAQRCYVFRSAGNGLPRKKNTSPATPALPDFKRLCGRPRISVSWQNTA